MSILTDLGIPTTGAKWLSVLGIVAGGLAGWAVHPLLWLCAGPVRWVCLLLATAAQESGYVADAVGDTTDPRGTSVGVLQFHAPNVDWLFAGDGDARRSPTRSAYAAASYVEAALLSDVRWWLLAVPVLGLSVLRTMWRRGVSSAAADYIWSEAWSGIADDRRTIPAFLFWRLLTAPVALALGAGLLVALRRAR